MNPTQIERVCSRLVAPWYWLPFGWKQPRAGSAEQPTISDQEIDAKAQEFQLRPLDVQKDYVYGWLLKSIFERPTLAEQLVLKGGNAVRKGYLPDTRFSKDLDFSARQAITQTVLEAELHQVCAFVETQTGVQFIDKVIRGASAKVSF